MSEIIDYRGELSGAGIPQEVLAQTAVLLGGEFVVSSSATDEYGNNISLGDGSTGSTHDDCFFKLSPGTMALRRALLQSVLDLHSSFLRLDVDWSLVTGLLLDAWMPETTLRIRSNHRLCQVRVRRFPSAATFLQKLCNKSLIVDCTNGVARLS